MGRTSELAGAALNARGDVLTLGALPVLHLRELGQQVRLKAHRTGADALGTADAGQRLAAAGIVAREDGHGVGALADGHLVGGQGLAHHRTAGQQLVIAVGHTAADLDEVLHRRTHADEEVAGIGQALAGHGGITLEQRLALHHGLVDGIGRSDVLDDGTHVDGDGGRSRHLAVDDGIDELLLAALRVALLQGDYFDVVRRSTELLGALLGEQVDGGGLVGLDADVALADLGGLHEQLEAHENLVGMLHHQAVVGGDIRLTLYGVDDDALGLGRRRRGELDKRGEAGTAHTCNACRLHAVDDFLGSQFGVVADGL